MGLIDSLKAIVGAGAPPVRLDETAAEGAAEPAVAALITAIRSSFALQLRKGCTDAYLEAVVATTDLDPCSELLTNALGAPAKPFGQRPAFDAPMGAMIDSQGGIDKGQCLFLRRHADGRVAFAALWPWSNGVELTLRIGVYAAELTPDVG